MHKYFIKELFCSSGGTSLEQYLSNEGEYNFVSIGNYKNNCYFDDGKRILYNDKIAKYILNKHDICMVLNDKTKNGNIIGSSILIDENDKYIYNQRTQKLVCTDKVYPLYAYYLLNSPKMRFKILSLARGGTQIYVNYKDIENIELCIHDLPIQNKIGSFPLS